MKQHPYWFDSDALMETFLAGCHESGNKANQFPVNGSECHFDVGFFNPTAIQLVSKLVRVGLSRMISLKEVSTLQDFKRQQTNDPKFGF